MQWQKSPEDLVEVFGAALPEDERVVRKKMFGYPCAFVGGNMFTGVHQTSVIVRLPEAERKALLAHEGARIFEPMAGRPMKEYVVTPKAMLADQAALRGWMTKALEYAATLPAKETKAGKPKAARPKQGR